jgi:hypothetical protein
MCCSQDSDYKDYGFLQCDAMQSGVKPQSSGSKGGSTMPVHFYQTTKHHISNLHSSTVLKLVTGMKIDENMYKIRKMLSYNNKKSLQF